jgi:hypothetical protein
MSGVTYVPEEGDARPAVVRQRRGAAEAWAQLHNKRLPVPFAALTPLNHGSLLASRAGNLERYTTKRRL